MKLLFITPKYKFGGAERQMSILMNYLNYKDVDLTLLDLETIEDIKEKYKVKQFKTSFLELDKPIFLRLVRRIGKYLKISRYVKSNDFKFIIFFNLNLLPLVFLTRKKVIYSVREYNPRIFNNKIISLFMKRVALITTNNLPSYILLKRKYKNVLLQNNIVEFDFANNSNEMEEKKNYLIVSNFSKRKNILPVIEAFKELKEEGFKLRIAGKVVDKNYYEEIKKIMQNNGENIEILGFLSHDQLEKEYLRSEGIIHLSALEGTPNALLDAVKYKKKFIALKTPENLSIFSEARDFLIDENACIKKAVKKLTEKDYKPILNVLNKRFNFIYSEENMEQFFEELKRRS